MYQIYYDRFFLNTIKDKKKNKFVRIQRIFPLEKWILKIIKIDNIKKLKTYLKNTIKLFSKFLS